MSGAKKTHRDHPDHDVSEPHVTANAPVVTTTSAVTATEDYGDDVNDGLSDVVGSEMMIPFLRMLQSNSPSCVEGSPAYNKDHRAGMLYHSATEEVYPKDIGVGFIPVYRTHSFTEWNPIDAGGGFRGSVDPVEPRVVRLLREQGTFKKLIDNQTSTELVETYSVYGIVAALKADGSWDNETASQCVISFTSTQIRKYKQLITRLVSLIGRPERFPLYAWRWHLSTQPEKNKKGSYYGWRITLAEDTADGSRLSKNDQLYHMARSLHHMVKDGIVQADYAASGAATDVEVQQGGGAGTTEDGENIPF